jgi:5-formyltetrahydrofolate cyclo-ligase
MQTRQELRDQIRQRRNSLADKEQEYAAQSLALHAEPLVKHVNSVALYLTNDGEIDTSPLINTLKAAEKQLAFPIIHPFAKGNLLFQAVNRDTHWTTNKYNIVEPKLDVRHVCPLESLDIIFLPLVAFDKEGNRLGMGGGFYDRTLSRLHTLKNKPILIGLAHDCQEVEKLPFEPWDVPTNIIVTPSKLITVG